MVKTKTVCQHQPAFLHSDSKGNRYAAEFDTHEEMEAAGWSRRSGSESHG